MYSDYSWNVLSSFYRVFIITCLFFDWVKIIILLKLMLKQQNKIQVMD